MSFRRHVVSIATWTVVAGCAPSPGSGAAEPPGARANAKPARDAGDDQQLRVPAATHHGTESVDAGSLAVSAPKPTLEIPPDIASAPAWVHRSFSTTKLPRFCSEPPHQITTYTLRHSDSRAVLTIDEQTADRGAKDGDIGAWSPATTRRYYGAAETRGRGVRLSLALVTESGTPPPPGADPAPPPANPESGMLGGEQFRDRCAPNPPPAKLDLVCAPETLAVAKASAKLKRRAPRHAGCDGDGKWVPAATTIREILACREPGEEDRWAVFSLAPGVEWLYVNDDCDLQDGGWRQIPEDGSVAEPRY